MHLEWWGQKVENDGDIILTNADEEKKNNNNFYELMSSM